MHNINRPVFPLFSFFWLVGLSLSLLLSVCQRISAAIRTIIFFGFGSDFLVKSPHFLLGSSFSAYFLLCLIPFQSFLFGLKMSSSREGTGENR